MKWLILSSFLVCWARFGVRCEETALSEAQVKRPIEVKCLAGTEWESNCHQCRCLPFGIALCHKLEPCDTSPSAEPITCKPNTVFHRDCNSCLCLANGDVKCSTNTCQRSDIPKKSDLLPGKECSPGSKWTSQCNECTCSSEGYPTCTEMKCSGQETETVFSCAPESVWKNDCNTCWCTDGRAVCTKIGCSVIPALDFNVDSKDYEEIVEPAPEYEVKYTLKDDQHNVLKRSVCKSNSQFQMECNPCKCAANGESFSCTHNECMESDNDNDTDIINKDVEVFMESEGVDHIERHSVCEPLGIFYIACNTCCCNHDGSDFSCTNKLCPLPDDVELFESKDFKALKSNVKEANGTKAVICSANRMFIKDCNTCWCNEDGTSYFCTRKVCVSDLPDEVDAEVKSEQNARLIMKQCRPDEVFEIDCNMCRCNADGKSFSCTRRACYSEDDTKNTSLTRKTRASPQEPPKACQPGQEFRMDCNKCLCDNEGQDFSCTRIDCNALNNNNNGGARRKRDTTVEVAANCTAGSVFQKECNVCRCGADGLRATCTAHDCDQVKVEQGVDASDADPNFRCNPGEQFKRECNDCTCSADGKSVFCTLRLCSIYQP